MALARAYTRSEDTPCIFASSPKQPTCPNLCTTAPPQWSSVSHLAQILATRPLGKSCITSQKTAFALLNGGPTEETDVLMVQSLMHHPAENLVGRFSLLQFAGLLKRCAAIITLDSFPMHLAAALGIPTIALFGANSSTLWGPYPGNYPRIVVEPPPEIPRNAQAMKWIQTTHVIDAYNRLAHSHL